MTDNERALHRLLVFDLEELMRYHFGKPEYYENMYGETYRCDHPVYDTCTLFKMGKKGLAVIQQRFDGKVKTTKWDAIDPWLTDAIYLHKGFLNYFQKHAALVENGLFPTVTVRKLMWALRMKPIKKERWETTFDRQMV